jgi:hypothetical protein
MAEGSERVRRPGNVASRFLDRAYRRYVPLPFEYQKLIDRIQQQVVPRTYVEIGVFGGRTLALALPGTAAVGVDPEPAIRFPLTRHTRVFSMTSDDFFADNDLDAILGRRTVDLAFIDGMHLFEFALRDFMHLERYGSGATTVLVHDCNPVDEVSARRHRASTLWTGDVWKLIVCLKKWRPDLRVVVVDVAPSGLGMISGLDPSSTVLGDHYEEILEEYVNLPFAFLEQGDRKEALNVIPNDWSMVRAMLPTRRRRLFSVSMYKARRVFAGAIRSGR